LSSPTTVAVISQRVNPSLHKRVSGSGFRRAPLSNLLLKAFCLGLANGGETTVDGDFKANLQRNSRLGSTLSIPIAPRHSLKIAYTSGLSTRLGADFDSISVLYQYIWGGTGGPSE